MKEITLNNGKKMPKIGLGTWKIEPKDIANTLNCAIVENNYRHIDCAPVYKNQEAIGTTLTKIFKTTQIKRKEIFITSKLWNHNHAKQHVQKACENTLKELQLDYLDLYLIHWGISVPHALGLSPKDENNTLITDSTPLQETWHAMEKLVQKGLVKSIGVSNYTCPMIVDLLSYANIIPAVNQIELHPYLSQQNLVNFCKQKNIHTTAYSPLGSSHTLQDPTIQNLAKKHKTHSSQIILRWLWDKNIISIPKSQNPIHIEQNINIENITLSKEDTKQINALNKNYRYIDPYTWWGIPYFS